MPMGNLKLLNASDVCNLDTVLMNAPLHKAANLVEEHDSSQECDNPNFELKGVEPITRDVRERALSYIV